MVKIQQGNIWGRLGSGIGQGLGEQLPKEIERGRLASGLRSLGEKKDLDPYQQFTELASIPGAASNPALLQQAGQFLRQRSLIDSTKQENSNQKDYIDRFKPTNIPNERDTATTTESTQSRLNPYVPPNGEQQENMARQKLASDPQAYPTIEEARSAVSREVAADTSRSNSLLEKANLEESVQSKGELSLIKQLDAYNAKIPAAALVKLQKKAINDITSGKLSVDEAKQEYGKIGDQISKDFDNINALGGIGFITNAKGNINSIEAIQKALKEYGLRKEGADQMISSAQVTPEFAYASMFPVKEIKVLNDEIKNLDKYSVEKKIPSYITNKPEFPFNYIPKIKNRDYEETTKKVTPNLVKAMAKEGSPLSIAYELNKRGLDGEYFKRYLLDNIDDLNLTREQENELGKPQPGFFGVMNDFFLSSFTGAK